MLTSKTSTTVVPDAYSDESPVRELLAELGSRAELRCPVSPGLRPPVTYRWSREEGDARKIDRESVRRGSSLVFPSVRADHAGTYVCRADGSGSSSSSSNATSTSVSVVLLVTGLVPHFRQAPISFMALETMPESNLQFDVEISFRPEAANGLIFYNGQTESGGSDFVSFGLRQGVPEFRYNLGSGSAVIRSEKSITFGEWHTVRLSRNRQKGSMWVDDDSPAVTGSSPGRFKGLDLLTPFYLGGVPQGVRAAAAEDTGIDNGFKGCISRLLLNGRAQSLAPSEVSRRFGADAVVGVGGCGACADERPCRNGAVCQEDNTDRGYRCICKTGFSGRECQKVGDTCYPGACNGGRCSNSDSGFVCACPFGRSGPRCEEDAHVDRPHFDGNQAYMAFKRPRHILRSFRFRVNFAAASPVSDGVIAYCAQDESGKRGDFASLAIKDGRLEFRFNTGSGPAILRLEHDIEGGRWYRVDVNRRLREATVNLTEISSDGEEDEEELQVWTASGKAPGSTRGLNIKTPVYFGGVNRDKYSIAPGVGVDSDFRGCISGLHMGLMAANGKDGSMAKLAKFVVDSANIRECSLDEECAEGVCQNGGMCRKDEDGFKCYCQWGFAGRRCDKVVKLGSSVGLRGDGFVELRGDLLDSTSSSSGVRLQSVTFEISTWEGEGRLLWHRGGGGEEAMEVEILDGRPSVSLHTLNSTTAVTARSDSRVDDGERHRIRATRKNGQVALQVGEDSDVWFKGVKEDAKDVEESENGNIFVGGFPGGYGGFNGCLHSLTVAGDKVDFRDDDVVVRTGNVVPCGDGSDYDYRDDFYSVLLDENMVGFDEDEYLERLNRIRGG